MASDFSTAPLFVLVPVRNEETRLPALLSALAHQTYQQSFTACFYFDNCRDRSEQIVADFHSTSPFRIRTARGDDHRAPNAGRARRRAVAIGLEMADDANSMFFSTDADTVPRADWLEGGRRALATCDVVAGAIARDTQGMDEQQDEVEAYYDRLYAVRRRIDPLPWEPALSHHFSGGANLAFWSDIYRALGGFQDLPSGEDSRFLDDASRAGYRVSRDNRMKVVTSARRIGRAPDGLATSLKYLDMGKDALVAHPGRAIWQYRMHRDARLAFPALRTVSVVTALGASLGLSADHILGVARDCPNAESFAMRIVPAPKGCEQLVSIATAMTALDQIDASNCALPPIQVAA